MNAQSLLDKQPAPSLCELSVTVEARYAAVFASPLFVRRDTMLELLEARQAQDHGYSQKLSTFDGRNTMADLVQEYLDAVMYAMKLWMETGDLRDFEMVRDAVWVLNRAIDRALT